MHGLDAVEHPVAGIAVLANVNERLFRWRLLPRKQVVWEAQVGAAMGSSPGTGAAADEAAKPKTQGCPRILGWLQRDATAERCATNLPVLVQVS